MVDIHHALILSYSVVRQYTVEIKLNDPRIKFSISLYLIRSKYTSTDIPVFFTGSSKEDNKAAIAVIFPSKSKTPETPT